MNEYNLIKYPRPYANKMAATSEEIIYDDEEETGLVDAPQLNLADFERVINQGVFPAPLKVEEEPADETNEHLPGVLAINKSGQLLKRYITWEGFGDHHIEVYDHWILNSAKNNVYLRVLNFKDGRVISFENLRIMKPHYTRDGKPMLMTPKLATKQG